MTNEETTCGNALDYCAGGGPAVPFRLRRHGRISQPGQFGNPGVKHPDANTSANSDTHAGADTHTDTHTDTHAYADADADADAHTHTDAYTYTHTDAHTHAYTYTHTHTDAHTHAYTYTHTDAYTHWRGSIVVHQFDNIGGKLLRCRWTDHTVLPLGGASEP